MGKFSSDLETLGNHHDQGIVDCRRQSLACEAVRTLHDTPRLLRNLAAPGPCFEIRPEKNNAGTTIRSKDLDTVPALNQLPSWLTGLAHERCLGGYLLGTVGMVSTGRWCILLIRGLGSLSSARRFVWCT